MNTSPYLSITGVILAGGKGRRMGGVDKGLVHYKQLPMVRHVIAALSSQVDKLLINANRNIEQLYRWELGEGEKSERMGVLVY